MDERENIFTRVYEEHADGIFRYFYYRLQDRDSALDLTQQVFSKLWVMIAAGK